MKEQLITFETALLAKEKGYTDDSKSWKYFSNAYGSYFTTNVEGGISKQEITVKIVTQSLLQKWLRETHFIYVYCIPAVFSSRGYHDQIWVISRTGHDKIEQTDSIFNTYEEALESGLQEALKLVK